MRVKKEIWRESAQLIYVVIKANIKVDTLRLWRYTFIADISVIRI
jgi:hypothetical protein